MGRIVGRVFPETEPEQDAAEIPAGTEPKKPKKGEKPEADGE